MIVQNGITECLKNRLREENKKIKQNKEKQKRKEKHTSW